MGRYSPTVIAQAGPSLADGLLGAVGDYYAVRDRKHEQQLQDTREQRDSQRFQNELAMSKLQMTNLDLRNKAEQSAAAAAPYKQDAEMRQAGYVPTYTPEINLPAPAVAGQPSQGSVSIGGQRSGYKLDPQLAPFSPREAFANQLAQLQHKENFEHGENVYKETAATQRANAANTTREGTSADANAARIRAAQISAGARTDAARIAHPALDLGTDVAGLAKMSPAARQTYFGKVATTALQSADQELPAGDTVLLNGQMLPRADARRKLAAQKVMQNPTTSQYFSLGMTGDHIIAADQKFGERPAARQDAKAAKKEALMQAIMGNGPAGPATPKATPPFAAPSPRSGLPNDVLGTSPTANTASKIPLSLNEKVKAKGDPKFAAWLTSRGYQPTDWQR